MKVLAFKVGQEHPETIELYGLKGMQEFVKGYIETLTLTPGIVLVCNDEGKYTQPPNRPLWINGAVRDVLHGDFFLCGVGINEDGEYDLADIPLNDPELYQVLDWLGQ